MEPKSSHRYDFDKKKCRKRNNSSVGKSDSLQWKFYCKLYNLCHCNKVIESTVNSLLSMTVVAVTLIYEDHGIVGNRVNVIFDALYAILNMHDEHQTIVFKLNTIHCLNNNTNTIWSSLETSLTLKKTNKLETVEKKSEIKKKYANSIHWMWNNILWEFHCVRFVLLPVKKAFLEWDVYHMLTWLKWHIFNA